MRTIFYYDPILGLTQFIFENETKQVHRSVKEFHGKGGNKTTKRKSNYRKRKQSPKR